MRSLAGTLDVSADDYAYTALVVSEQLELLREFQARCTCDTTSVWQCPNYVPGDEVRIKGDDDMRSKKQNGEWEDLGPGGGQPTGKVSIDMLVAADPNDESEEDADGDEDDLD